MNNAVEMGGYDCSSKLQNEIVILINKKQLTIM